MKGGTAMAEHAEHRIVLDGRRVLDITGVRDVSSLSPDEVEMTLDEGSLLVEGQELKIDGFSSESGKLRVLGEVQAVSYFEKSVFKKGFFKKRG